MEAGNYACVLSADLGCSARRQCGVLNCRLLRCQNWNSSCQKMLLPKAVRIFPPELHTSTKQAKKWLGWQAFLASPDTRIVTYCLGSLVAMERVREGIFSVSLWLSADEGTLSFSFHLVYSLIVPDNMMEPTQNIMWISNSRLFPLAWSPGSWLQKILSKLLKMLSLE